MFGVEKLYLTGITGAPPRKEIAKVALGSEHRVAWEQVDDVFQLIDRLKSQGYTVVALENHARASSIEQYCPAPLRPSGYEGQVGQNALVLGNEVGGIEPDLLAVCDLLVEIPMIGHKQSLNVSVAAGIALFALTRRTR